MSTKLIQTKDYLLLIDEEAEIKPKSKVWWEDPEDGLTSQLNTVIEVNEELIFMSEPHASEIEALPQEVSLVIAYYPLTKEANELDLPLLPNPFEEVSIEKMAIKRYPLENFKEETWLRRNGFIEGYKAAQSKQFSLEDMKDILEEGLNWFGNGRDKEISDSETWFNHYIQSLSTQQLPKEFVPEYEESCSCFAYSSIGCNFENNKDNITSRQDKCEKEYKLKTITNSEGKKELVGTYKY